MNETHLRMGHSARETIVSSKNDQYLSQVTNHLTKGQSRALAAEATTKAPKITQTMPSIFSQEANNRKKATASMKSVTNSKKKTKAPTETKTKSVLGMKFAEKSFIEGMFHEETPRKMNTTNDEGLIYEVSASLTTRREGIVSLADAVDLISFVTCVNPSMIKITFKNTLSKNEALESMFPLGAILAVKADIFGHCMENSILSNSSVIGFNQDLYRLVSNEGDGYLIISTLSQDSLKTVSITGTRATFFDMFDQGNIQFRAIDDQSRRQLLERVHQYDQKLEFFQKALIVALKMRIIERNGIKSGNFNFGWWGFEFNVILAIENKLTLDAETYISQPLVKKRSPIKSLLSELLGPPPLKILSMAQKAGVFDRIGKLPDLKLGVYLELVTYLDFETSIVYPIGPAVNTTATLGKKEVSVDVVFKPFNLQAYMKADVVKDDKANFGSNVYFKYGDDVEARFKLLWTFQPQVVLYLTDYCSAGYGYPFGPELALKGKMEGIFTPVKQDTGGPKLIGSCDTCHKIQGTVDAVVQSPFFALVLKDYVKETIKSEGWTDRISLLKMCYIGTSCCSGSSDPCCGNPVDPCCSGNPDPSVQCCLNSDCEDEKGFICKDKQCICDHECCDDEGCGDASLYRCVENSCRSKVCNITSGMVQCCVDNDCTSGRVCQDNICISKGNPRFTLSWYGDGKSARHYAVAVAVTEL